MNMAIQKTVLIMAGGTGGHIFPGLAVAIAMRDAGWRVHWLGGRGSQASPSMESQIVPASNFSIDLIEFAGVRGKGPMALLALPWRLMRACWQSTRILRQVKPDVVVGFGGYITLPAGLMSFLMGKPIVIHEQNSVAGMANKVLARFAKKVFTAFPAPFSESVKQARWIGNPLRAEFVDLAAPEVRYRARRGPLKLLVLGGSLGAKTLNEVVPQALAMLPPQSRPLVTHQSGQKHIEQLRTFYNASGISANLTPFISDTSQAYAEADLVICRSGASTVTEVAAVGVAAVFVPFPSAVDDHQTTNASFLVDEGGGWLVRQQDLTVDRLARMLLKADRSALMISAVAARKMAKFGAVERVRASCDSIANARGKS